MGLRKQIRSDVDKIDKMLHIYRVKKRGLSQEAFQKILEAMREVDPDAKEAIAITKELLKKKN